MNADDKARLDQAKEIMEIQGLDGNWNYDEYMHGMYNGMALMIALIEGTPTVPYKNAPEKFVYEDNSATTDKFMAGILKNGIYDGLIKEE